MDKLNNLKRLLVFSENKEMYTDDEKKIIIAELRSSFFYSVDNIF